MQRRPALRSARWGAAFAAGAIALTAALTGCSSSDPLSEDGGAGDTASAEGGTIVVGSQDYYSNEIIAEIYAQALEADGFDVDRQFRIGQREVYLPEIESGKIDLFPEYSGNLLQYFEADAPERVSDEVYDALVEAMPEGLRVLEQSPATDQDTYVVTREFAEKWDLETVEDLGNVTDPLTFGSNSEAETRPYGPAGLAETYGIEGVQFTPIEDSGGPLTVKALKDGAIQFANIYSADPSLAANDLVTLEDTKGIFLASHVVPIASEKIDDQAESVINEVDAALSPEDLVELNGQSVNDERSAADIAKEWLDGQSF
ncbi:ABC transporter substrate-binding protein [Leucobacter alluvii]|uniref:ABC transporter substrate-binding protein n=1 Tax=Leucobacter alluvii TaxID=340321 RepID=A0ABP5MZG1_9MICO|nr:ABC transporter substrate-binding protein [Leucobacter sp. L43]